MLRDRSGEFRRITGWLAVWIGAIVAATPGAAAPQGIGQVPREGLDSLAAATLTRALDLLEVAPSELGFDKLYAEDDTFRLAIVEELLLDPLRLPPWQERTVDAIRESIDDPGAIAAFLGSLVEAEVPDATPAVPPALGGGPEVAVRRFVERCKGVEASLDRAFARLDAAERTAILVLAPAIWGDWEEPGSVDRMRKGEIHFERGFPADTTIALSEKPILDAAAKLDRRALTAAAAAFHAAWSECATALLAAPPGGGGEIPGVTGTIEAIHETPWGLLVVGGAGDNTYRADALDRIAFIVERGGSDLYRGRVASAIGGLTRPLAAIWDAAGDDLYDGSGRSYLLGGAILGIASLIDGGGNDLYRGGDGSSGAGFFGVGIVQDAWGVDSFEGRNFSQGAGAFGIGALICGARAEPPPGPPPEKDRAFEAGLVPVPGTGAVPVRYDENDIYRCDRQSQGFASTFGAGLLYDRAGSDTYRSGGGHLHKPLRPDDFQSLSQGFSIGFRPRAGGGVGILIDEEGNDFYDAEIYAQGTSYWYSIGLLHDRAGNDRYLAAQYAQGAGVHLAIGSLWDRGGNDHYVCHLGVTQGTAHDLSVGWQIDESGDDYYAVSDGQGMSITNSTAIFIDGQGNDLYATTGVGQGTLTWARDFCGAGIFIDLEGKDTYPAKSGGADGAIWSHDLYAIGIDLDRDIELPGEVIPEPVLTAADSARSVEDLFAEASIWEVGTAREKVARARKALLTKGIAAVDYVVREKLGSDDGLEYRAIQAVAESMPDSFTARVLPRLLDPKEQVQKNVIALLGDMKRKEAVPLLLEILSRKPQEKHWNRSIQALGKIGERSCAARLRPYLGDPLERRRIVTVAALAALKDTAAVPLLVERLAGDPILTVRSAASNALRGFGGAAVPGLRDRLAGDPDHRAALVQTLGRIAVALKDATDPPAVGPRGTARKVLMNEFDRPGDGRGAPARAAAVETLLKLGGEEMRSFVDARMLDETDPLVKRTYARFTVK